MGFQLTNPQTDFGLVEGIFIARFFWSADSQYSGFYLQGNDARQYYDSCE